MSDAMKKRTDICTWVCGGLMLLLLILQFVPFWNVDGQGISISTYIWFPTNHPEVTSYMKGELGDSFAVNQIVLMPVIHLVACVVGMILCLMKKPVPVWILAVIAGVAGIFGFAAGAAFRLGSAWVLHLLICIVLLVAGIYTLLLSTGKIKK